MLHPSDIWWMTTLASFLSFRHFLLCWPFTFLLNFTLFCLSSRSIFLCTFGFFLPSYFWIWKFFSKSYCQTNLNWLNTIFTIHWLTITFIVFTRKSMQAWLPYLTTVTSIAKSGCRGLFRRIHLLHEQALIQSIGRTYNSWFTHSFFLLSKII